MAFNKNKKVEPLPLASVQEISQKLAAITRYLVEAGVEIQVDRKGLRRRLQHTAGGNGMAYSEKNKHVAAILADMWRAIKTLNYAAGKTGSAAAHINEVFVRTRREQREPQESRYRRQPGPQGNNRSPNRRQPNTYNRRRTA